MSIWKLEEMSTFTSEVLRKVGLAAVVPCAPFFFPRYCILKMILLLTQKKKSGDVKIIKFFFFFHVIFIWFLFIWKYTISSFFVCVCMYINGITGITHTWHYRLPYVIGEIGWMDTYEGVNVDQFMERIEQLTSLGHVTGDSQVICRLLFELKWVNGDQFMERIEQLTSLGHVTGDSQAICRLLSELICCAMSDIIIIE